MFFGEEFQSFIPLSFSFLAFKPNSKAHLFHNTTLVLFTGHKVA